MQRAHHVGARFVPHHACSGRLEHSTKSYRAVTGRQRRDTGVANAEGNLTAAEKAAVNSLESKPAYKRLAELDSDISSVMLANRNREDPESDRLIQETMRKAIEEHMAAAAAAGSPAGE